MAKTIVAADEVNEVIVDGEGDTECVFVWGAGRGMSGKGDSSSRCCWEASVIFVLIL